MQTNSLHNPDRYMADLRQILGQGRKRIGIFIGAGAPTAIQVDENNHITEGGFPLVPNVVGLTNAVIGAITDKDREIIDFLKEDIEGVVNIEDILTRIRKLAQAIGNSIVHGLDGKAYDELAKRICVEIGSKVQSHLPNSPNPYSKLVSWISGTQRDHSVEIFTPNYDLLIEEAFERAQVPYFDGFTGSYKPFFDPASISSDQLPARWSRLWKLHGSLGWKVLEDKVIRTGQRDATELIFPDHLKYDQVTRLPYSALFERLRGFLTTPDTLLICTGFSFLDSHICAVLDETLAANAHTAVFAFQYHSLNCERAAASLALRRPNMSVYSRDGAIINGVEGIWQPGEAPNDDWLEIRQTFWRGELQNGQAEFLLGDFAKLAQFLALTQAQQLSSFGTGQGQDDLESDEHSIHLESTNA